MKGLITMMTAALFSFSSYAVEATHGMVIFGQEHLYAYHLPMFHKVHNRQMVITFDVPKEVKDQIVKLEEDQYLTFVPTPFDLDKFAEAPFDLKGDLYSGHFEKDGVVVMSDITLSAPKILYLQTLVKPEVGKQESYKIFGTSTDAYALHLMNGGAAIDQIFKLTTIEAGNFDWVTKNHSLYNRTLLEKGQVYDIDSAPGKCPSRLCGSVGFALATFKVDSLYFTDEVM